MACSRGETASWSSLRRRFPPKGNKRWSTIPLDCTPKMRQEVKGPNTLNGEVYGFGPKSVQQGSEDCGDAGDRRRPTDRRSGAAAGIEPPSVGALALRVAGAGRVGLSWHWPARRFTGDDRVAADRRTGAQNRPADDGE